MKYADLEQKTLSELYDLYGNLKKEQLNLRVQKATAGLKSTARVREMRRDVARIETRLTALKKA